MENSRAESTLVSKEIESLKLVHIAHVVVVAF